MDQESAKSVVTRFLETFSGGDVDAIMDMMTDDATWWVAGTLELSGTKTKAEFRELLSGISELCEGPIALTPKSMIAEGNTVAAEVESLAHLKNGRVYNNEYHFLIEVRGNQVCRVKEYLDTMHTHDTFFVP